MQLSKCSIGFEFDPDGNYEPALLEISTAIEVLEEIEHGSYGHPDYRIVTGYRYNGEDIEEAIDAELRDRITLTDFLVINAGKTTVIYSNYNGNEEWADQNLLQRTFKFI